MSFAPFCSRSSIKRFPRTSFLARLVRNRNGTPLALSSLALRRASPLRDMKSLSHKDLLSLIHRIDPLTLFVKGSIWVSAVKKQSVILVLRYSITMNKNECPQCHNLKQVRSGLCQSCRILNYQQEWNKTHKTCTKCTKYLPLESFYPKRKFFSPMCKECERKLSLGRYKRLSPEKKEKVNQRRKIQRKQSPHYSTWKLRQRITTKGLHDDKNKILGLLKTQESCSICQTPFSETKKGPVVDHSHVSGKFRGIICSNCNLGLGCFRDNPNFLEAAITYLKLLQPAENLA